MKHETTESKGFALQFSHTHRHKRSSISLDLLDAAFMRVYNYFLEAYPTTCPPIDRFNRSKLPIITVCENG